MGFFARQTRETTGLKRTPALLPPSDYGSLYRNVCSLAADPTTPTVLYAGTYGTGVFKSTDKGDHWNAVNTGLTDLHVGSLVISSVAPATLTVATDSGIFRLVRGGATWTMANVGITNHTLALAVDPNAGGRLCRH